MPPEFVPLAEHIVDALLESDPHLASFAGDHRFDEGLADLPAEAPDLAPSVVALRDRAAEELDSFVEWLRGRPTGDRDPRLGRRLWEARLWHTLDTELPAAEIASRAEANLARLQQQ